MNLATSHGAYILQDHSAPSPRHQSLVLNSCENRTRSHFSFPQMPPPRLKTRRTEHPPSQRHESLSMSTSPPRLKNLLLPISSMMRTHQRPDLYLSTMANLPTSVTHYSTCMVDSRLPEAARSTAKELPGACTRSEDEHKTLSSSLFDDLATRRAMTTVESHRPRRRLLHNHHKRLDG